MKLKTAEIEKKSFNNILAMQENLDKALHDGDFLRGDISSAYTIACTENPAVALLLFDLITNINEVNRRISEVRGCVC
jgi:hypothetical protein